MKEYIERASVHSIIEQTSTLTFTRGKMHEQVDSLPTADVAEVRHGRWIRQPSEISGLDVEFCSECGQGMNERNQFWNAKYCPHCGARMDEEDEHEAS